MPVSGCVWVSSVNLLAMGVVGGGCALVNGTAYTAGICFDKGMNGEASWLYFYSKEQYGGDDKARLGQFTKTKGGYNEIQTYQRTKYTES